MTQINLHGILKYEFGEVIPLNITRPREVVDAIDCIKKNFRARIYELARENVHFNIIADGESVKNFNQLEMKKNFKQIDIVPVVAGAIEPITITFYIIQIALLIASIAIQLSMRPKPPKPERIESEVSANKKSFLISSATNLTQQGNPVPVGYGRLRVGSYTIQSCVKSHPQNQPVGDVLKEKGTSSQSVQSQIAVPD
jgi:predicted phage tail protein